VAGLLLGASFIGSMPGAVLAAPPQAGATATSIVVQGNRRVEADTIRSYFKAAPGEHLDAAKIDAGLKALYASGLFQDVQFHNRATSSPSPSSKRRSSTGSPSKAITG
jgi:outer membrane protein insertion porin family